MVNKSALSIATSVPALNCKLYVACFVKPCFLGSITTNLDPLFAARFRYVAATGWFSVGLAPITMTQSASDADIKGADTAPEFTHSISAATEDA